MEVGVRARSILILILATALGVGEPAAADDANQAAIRSALVQWTADFNARHADRVCDLFEPGIVADIRGEPEQDHKIICDRLKRVLSDNAHTHTYSPDIKEILVFGDVAVVRLVWTLTIMGGGEDQAKSVEQGTDIFRRQPDGSWKIMRFMAYSQ